ncbi:MAG: hypothetical protein PF637_02915 [Spirochaetes bacterium]|jgi:class 3 adenylate cyclase|nr:hypothetical protein [Spirochaetota bacterium]
MIKKHIKRRSTDPHRMARIYYIFTIMVFVVINCISLLFVNFVFLNYQENLTLLVRKTLTPVYPASMLLAVIAVSFFLLPFIKRHGLELTESRKKRLLTVPVIVGLFNLTAVLFAFIYAGFFFFVKPEIHTSHMVSYIVTAMLLGFIPTISIMVVLDCAGRFWFVPYFFRSSSLNSFCSIFSFSLRKKSVLLLIVLHILPVAVYISTLFGSVQISSNSKTVTMIIITSVLFFIFSILLLTLFIRQIRIPVLKLARMNQKISRGKYSNKLPISSDDEIAFLTETANDAAVSLHEKELIEDTFGGSVDPKVREFLLKGNLKPEGEQNNATLLVADIHDFRKITSFMEADLVVSYLNCFFDRMSSLVESNGGLINKYVGDALLSVYGTPMVDENHVTRTLETAISMRENLVYLNRELAENNLPALEFGTGIHTGEVVTGNVGSKARMPYTVIGEPVSIVSRMQNLTTMYHVPVLLTGATYDLLENKEAFHIRYIDCVRIPESEEPIRVYELFDSDKEKHKRYKKRYLEDFDEAMAYYQDSEFEKALNKFEYCRKELPWDYISAMYVKRCSKLIEKAPSNWNAVAIINR